MPKWENEASIAICLSILHNLVSVSSLSHSFHYFRKWDCCSFALKRTLPPILRSQYYSDFSASLSSHPSFFSKIFCTPIAPWLLLHLTIDNWPLYYSFSPRLLSWHCPISSSQSYVTLCLYWFLLHSLTLNAYCLSPTKFNPCSLLSLLSTGEWDGRGSGELQGGIKLAICSFPHILNDKKKKKLRTMAHHSQWSIHLFSYLW